MNIDASKFINSMRDDWDTRARKNAFHYIASWRQDWNESSFFESGEEDYQKFVEVILQRHAIPSNSEMIEVGCGAGRMTRSFARRFIRVAAVDVSSEMLKLATTLHGDVGNITWIQGNGINLAGIPDDSLDFAFSYLVLQHLPTEELVQSYISEMLRVLKVGGVCLFQFNGTTDNNMNWRGRMAWALMDSLRELRLHRISKFAASLLNFDAEMAGKTWHGTDVKSTQVADTVRKNGGAVLEFLEAETPMAWCCARKSRQSENTHNL